MTSFAFIESPIGALLLRTDGEALTGVWMGATDEDVTPGWMEDARQPVIAEAGVQLEQYFRGERRGFELPLRPRGTEFQRQVWDELLKIPYGQTTSYGEIAKIIGKPLACRAVGAANGQNPLPIIVPCHRVIGASGALTGFGG